MHDADARIHCIKNMTGLIKPNAGKVLVKNQKRYV